MDSIGDQLETFASLYARACQRKGGPDRLVELVAMPQSTEALLQMGDDRYLAEMTKKIFQSGFVWRVVRDKWDDFERVFFGFDIHKILLMPDEMLEKKAQDPSIIRNYNKVKTIRDNAMMIDSVAKEHGSFATMVANWPQHDTIGLWAYLKKHGARLGGNTGPYALRTLGKDTFILSRDVEAYFRQHRLIDGGLQSKRSLNRIQEVFNTWQRESGKSLAEISQIVAFGTGDNLA